MRTASVVVVLILSGIATAADKPKIDSAVAAAWGFSATPAVQPMPETMPSYRLYQDARGQWWQVPTNTPAQEVLAPAPFRPAPSTTPRTVVQNAAVVSTGSAATYPAVGTFTLARPGTVGNIRCVSG